jgi:hypothetical protein
MLSFIWPSSGIPEPALDFHGNHPKNSFLENALLILL